MLYRITQVHLQPYICHWRYILSTMPPPEDIADLQSSLLSPPASASLCNIAHVAAESSLPSSRLNSTHCDGCVRAPEILMLRRYAVEEGNCNSHLQELVKSAAQSCIFHPMQMYSSKSQQHTRTPGVKDLSSFEAAAFWNPCYFKQRRWK